MQSSISASRLSGWTLLTIQNINVTDNDVISGMNALNVEMYHVGYYMYDLSRIEQSDILITDNVINSSWNGILFEYAESAKYMYDSASVIQDNVIISYNTVNMSIGGNYGIYFEY